MPIDRNNGALLALGAAGALAAIGAAVKGRRRGSRDHGEGIVERVGDVDPITYGGGVVFEDENGNYTLEYTYGAEADPTYQSDEPDPDFEHVVYRVQLERSLDELLRWFDWIDLDGVADSIGSTKADMLSKARSGGVLGRAMLIEDVAGYYGWGELDDYGIKIREAELEKRWELD